LPSSRVISLVAAPTGLILEIDVSERVPVSVADNEGLAYPASGRGSSAVYGAKRRDCTSGFEVLRKPLSAVLYRLHRDLGAFSPDDLEFFVFKLVGCVEDFSSSS
jgi:hypothetical protein